jgi:hypothetical protein
MFVRDHASMKKCKAKEYLSKCSPDLVNNYFDNPNSTKITRSWRILFVGLVNIRCHLVSKILSIEELPGQCH